MFTCAIYLFKETIFIYFYSDVNECSGSNDCVSPAVCANNVGSYTCTCPAGYTKTDNFNCQSKILIFKISSYLCIYRENYLIWLNTKHGCKVNRKIMRTILEGYMDLHTAVYRESLKTTKRCIHTLWMAHC